MGQKRLPAGQNSSYGHLNHVSVYVKREWNDNCPDAATPSISVLRMPTHAGRLERKDTNTFRPMTSRRAVSPSPQKSGPKPPRSHAGAHTPLGGMNLHSIAGRPIANPIGTQAGSNGPPASCRWDRSDSPRWAVTIPRLRDRAVHRVAGERKTQATLSIVYTMSAWFSSREKKLFPRFIRKNPLIRAVRSF